MNIHLLDWALYFVVVILILIISKLITKGEPENYSRLIIRAYSLILYTFIHIILFLRYNFIDIFNKLIEIINIEL
jgi:hypothetical protein